MKIKIIKRLLMLLMVAAISFSCSSCDFFSDVEQYREVRRNDLFNQINKIEKNPNYAFIHSGGYLSINEEINFQTLVEEKIREDGKNIKETFFDFNRFQDDIIGFIYRYKVEERFLGINDNNNSYAVGTISLNDYCISIQYLKCKYENFSSIFLSDTHYTFKGTDADNKTKDGEKTFKFITIDIKSGEMREWNNEEDALEFAGESIPYYYNTKKYTENGIEYGVSSSSLIPNDSQNNFIRVPTQYEVKEKSDEMKKIAEILDDEFHGIDGTFFTNGDELFIGFYASHGMFGIESNMTFPVIFKCDASFENFEYIGCINIKRINFQYLEVRRIK